MNKVLIIGAGGVGNVVAHKCAELSSVFNKISFASRTVSKCEAIAKNVKAKYNVDIDCHPVDADNVPELVKLLNKLQPNLVINVALPYQDLTIMDACLECNVHYLDTANYEPIDEAKFEYKWQWAYQEKFKDKGLMALLGCGFDPGVTNIYTAYAQKHHFDEMHYIDIVDCNGGDHGKAFATNFNPEINIREITQNGKYWKEGSWVETEPMEIHQEIDYPNIGERESYLMYHEEMESIVKNIPHIKQIRFWMTFGQEYIKHLQVLQNVGMTRIDPILYNGQEIVPLQFLKAVLPEPSELGENYTGLTCIGVQVRGIKDGQPKEYFVFNNCDHAKCYEEVKGQAVGYTTGVPAMIGAKMILTGVWKGEGVFNVEEFDPDPFMADLNQYGLAWNEMDKAIFSDTF